MPSVAGPQTFTVTNTGNQTITQIDFVFNTPSGVSHTADLTNFDPVIESNFTEGSISLTNVSLPAGQSRTFTVDYEWVNRQSNPLPVTGNFITLTPRSSAGSGSGVSIDCSILISEPVSQGEEWTIDEGTGGTFPYGVPQTFTLRTGLAGVPTPNGYYLVFDDSKVRVNGEASSPSTTGSFSTPDGQAVSTFTIANYNQSSSTQTSTISIYQTNGTLRKQFTINLAAYGGGGPLNWTISGTGGTLPYGQGIDITVLTGSYLGDGIFSVAADPAGYVSIVPQNPQLTRTGTDSTATFRITNNNPTQTTTPLNITLDYRGDTQTFSAVNLAGQPAGGGGTLSWEFVGAGGSLPYGASTNITLGAAAGVIAGQSFTWSVSPATGLTPASGSGEMISTGDGAYAYESSGPIVISNFTTGSSETPITLTVSSGGATMSTTFNVQGQNYSSGGGGGGGSGPIQPPEDEREER
jgi:hypothetical protein